ncbi:uncharacterized protein BYT42DRAFT_516473 [Radiomyces spectabilis]|uniref:uncharacterized protein n=1 Tax=Radiomyces spectabilis TaxID=64574 RepID=UPI00221EDD78|nr:uncharacterized protein BYT42DRAFT_516473 [Radiomyces spectabilis]KAI8378057.1 hypothetical protein BYT42DRAFT_516473 [Radiomyces spectabilis]
MSQGVTASNIGFDRFLSLDTLEIGTNKRPKSNPPCSHCQKAQLKCDGGRPCQGCVKRDLGTTCIDAGSHKKQKCTGDIAKQCKTNTQKAGEPKTKKGQFTNRAIVLSKYSFTYLHCFLLSTADDDLQQSLDADFLTHSQLFNFPLTDIGFNSQTAGLEYGILGNMLDLSDNGRPPLPNNNVNSNNNNSNNHYSSYPGFSDAISENTTNFLSSLLASSNASFAAAAVNLFPCGNLVKSNPVPKKSSPTLPPTPPTPCAISPASTSSIAKPSRESLSSTANRRRRPNSGNTPEAVYNSVQRPFNYAEGFHYLIQYVQSKMGKEDLTRISRALAMFRPSFLALIMNLTEEDLIFMEKCIQRTLLEYEKLVSFSGTPTVIWRRTGEICLVGKEFSLLTQWTKDMLFSKKSYIYELMDSQSAVEYWEKFGKHAFDNTDHSTMTSCILKTPQHKLVPCTFCFTIKRDIFDLPSIIIGNFLPILS